jgi:hypothetical protein
MDGLSRRTYAKIYGLVFDNNVKAAHLLATKISEGKVSSGSTPRDIYRAGWSSLKDKECVESALDILERCGWVQIIDEQKAAGGRPSAKIILHPDFQGSNHQSNSQKASHPKTVEASANDHNALN